MADNEIYRLVTRSDFDGLVCAVLLKELVMIDEIHFVHPRDMQEGKIGITGRDITTNLPYAEGVHLAFDHHMSETHRVAPHENLIIDVEAPSASRVLYRHYGGASRFPDFTAEMLAAVDRADAGQLTREEVFNPKEWVLLHFLLDPRTGLDRFRNFNVSDPELMRMLTDYCRRHTVQEVMEHFDVAERASRYFVLEEPFKEQIQRCAAVRGRIVVIDLRGDDPIWAGNRFMQYALFPDCNISIHLTRVPGEQRTELAVGKSIFDRSSRYHVGLEMLNYGGGGLESAGTCQVPVAEADETLEKIIGEVTAAG